MRDPAPGPGRLVESASFCRAHSLCRYASRTRITSDPAVDPLPLLAIARDKAIAISLPAHLVARLRTPSGEGRIQLGSSQSGFPAPVDQRTMVHGSHILGVLFGSPEMPLLHRPPLLPAS